jgi:CubicO group peptidase (beta-lactamase class C family)
MLTDLTPPSELVAGRFGGQDGGASKGLPMDVQGHCDDRFAEVADEFGRNFTERGELGASVSVTVGGETAVDVWGGWADAGRTTAWDKDTLCVMMSCTKGATALCAHLLAAAGKLDFDEPVTTYWPEFAATVPAKAAILVRHVLNHQAGLPALRQPVKWLPGAGRVGFAGRPVGCAAFIRRRRQRPVAGRDVPGHPARPGL